MTSPPRFVSPQATLAHGRSRRSPTEKISSVYVHAGDGAPRPADTGIVTERDILRVIAEHGTDALQQPVDRAMSQAARRGQCRCVRLCRDRADEPAAHPPSRRGRRAGTVVGALSARDLLHLRAQRPRCCSATTSARRRDVGRSRARLGHGAAGRGRLARRGVLRPRRGGDRLPPARRDDAPRGGAGGAA